MICVDAETGFVYFADHELVHDDDVVWMNPETKQYETKTGSDAEVLRKYLPKLSSNFEEFLVQLFQDELTDELEELG